MLRDVIKLLSDGAARAADAEVPLRLRDAGPEVHDAVLLARGGTIWVALWREVESAPAADVDARIRVDLGWPVAAVRHQPGYDSEMRLAVVDEHTVAVTVIDGLVLLALTPGCHPRTSP